MHIREQSMQAINCTAKGKHSQQAGENIQNTKDVTNKTIMQNTQIQLIRKCLKHKRRNYT